ncbi:hypothetical protein C5167_026140 [Papaver somniferum]|nr:hypothetical protein C5167_026140 [Papaver somniferum]
MASQLGVLMSKTSWAFQPNILRLGQYISIRVATTRATKPKKPKSPPIGKGNKPPQTNA